MLKNHNYDFTFLVKNILATLTFPLLSSETEKSKLRKRGLSTKIRQREQSWLWLLGCYLSLSNEVNFF